MYDIAVNVLIIESYTVIQWWANHKSSHMFPNQIFCILKSNHHHWL